MSVEIIGRACVAPGANSPEELFELLRAGACTVSTVPGDRWDLARFWHPEMGIPGKYYTYAAGVLDDIYGFDPVLFGISRREAMFMDPQQRLLLELTWRALEDANIPVSSLHGENVAVYVGASSLDHGNLSVEDPAAPGPHFMTGNTLSVVANRISHVFGLNGPSLTVDTACSSSLVALDHAVRALNAGEVDTAIVGGVNILVHPLPFVGFAQARMLSMDGLCKAYDNDGIGYVRAEGAAILVLRRSDRVAVEGDRSHATIVASGTNAAGRTNGISLPSREAQAALLTSVYIGNDIDPDQIAFIEGHGTGTKVGDPAEVWSLGTVIGSRRKAPIPIGSIKSNIGHAEPASGLLGVMKAMMALENDYLPASLHFHTPNDSIDFEGLNVRVANEAIELEKSSKPRLAGINSFGFGGANAHVVIADPKSKPSKALAKKGETAPLFMASAHTAESLAQLLKGYSERFAAAADSDEAAAVISAAGSSRSALRHRFVAKGSTEEIIAAVEAHLASPGSGRGEVGESISRDPKVALVFSGNGSQWAGMGIDAFASNADFRACFLKIAALFKSHSDIDLTEALSDPDLDEKLSDTMLAQPLLFAVQAALSDALVAMGLKVTATYGHSVGEVAAAYAARALSLDDAVSVIAKRSLHQAVLAGEGTMAAVKLGEDAALELIRALELDNLFVAAVNAPNSVTISGPYDQIKSLREKARKRKVAVQLLDINYPFHHPLIDKAKAAFFGDAPKISPRNSKISFISTVTGTPLNGEALTPEYWWQNVRQPVKFLHATEAAIALGCNVFLEVSPRPILSSYVSDIAQQVSASVNVVPTLQREESTDGQDPVSQSMARAVAFGAAVDEKQVFGKRNAFVSLPVLPFDKTDLHPESTSDRADIYGRTNQQGYTLVGWRVDPNGTTWKNHVDAYLFPDLAEHVVDDRAILPGSGFIEIALSAARLHFSSDHIEISNLEIVRPLELSQNRLFELSTVISTETGDLQIRSRERLSEDDWAVHAVARVRKLTASEHSEPVDFALEPVTAVVDAAKAYRTAANFGLDYGPRFQLMEKATCYGDRLVAVELRKPADAGHPLLNYNLNPLSVDAVFHGLVALFDRFSGEHGGAPYIPVRFGRIRIEAVGKTVRKAMVEIERISSASIKANFHLLDENGERIATLADCRFKRTYLKQHKSLDALSFHYEKVPSLLAKPDAALAGSEIRRTAPFFMPSDDGQLDNETFLFNAAVFRAIHDIAIKLGKGSYALRIDALPQDPEFRRFLVNGLHLLADAGFATYADGEWTFEKDCPLPPVLEVLGELYSGSPDRTVEIVLINDVYREVLDRLDAGEPAVDQEREDARAPSFISEATLDHFAIHSNIAKNRMRLLLAALRNCLTQNDGTQRTLRILELGSTSAHFSRELADLAASHAASLTIYEPDAGARRNLEIAFETDANVQIIDRKQLDALQPVDIVLSASDDLHDILDADMANQFANGRLSQVELFLAAQSAPGVANDFAFGLSKDWFSRSLSSEFPIGRLLTAAEWQKRLEGMGFLSAEIAPRDLPGGSLILIEALGRQPANPAEMPAATEDAAPGGSCIVLHDGRLGTARLLSAALSLGRNDIIPVLTTSDLEADKKSLLDAIDENAGKLRGVICLSPFGSVTAEDSSGILQDRVLALSALAAACSEYQGRPGAAKAQIRLVVVAPGGAPVKETGSSGVTSAVNAGLWAFARVLRNEYEIFDLRSIDTNSAADTPERLLDVAFKALELNGPNREWLLDEKTGALSELRIVPGASVQASRTTREFEAAVIRQQVPSQVTSIRWENCATPQIGPSDVLVKVAATGLNFRDVMWAMGMLPEEALEDGFAGASIGMEFSGEVVSVGSDITDLVPGDNVMAIAASAFSTHVSVNRAGVAKLPAGIDPVSAATIPVVFLTAYYAINELGRMRPNETILIHGAAGGVGLAALQVAKHVGATVIATAGTEEKRRFLETLGADHVFDSRSLGFVQDVLDVTDGKGVDLVLNSLFGEAMEQSLSLVKPFGRFLELGKRDYYADSKIGLRPFRRNVSYFGIDADQLLVLHPDLSRRMLTEIGALFEQGIFSPLPFRAFEFDEIGDAFRLMQNAGHIGKIVVLPPVSGRDRIATRPIRSMTVDPKGMHLVVGGIGGFGLMAAEWLVEKGARHIALCSRRGTADDETAAAIARWTQLGLKTELHACDVTRESDVAAMLKALRTKAPLKTVIHAAMVLDDAFIANLTKDRNRPVIDVKAKGGAILDKLTRADSLDNFILFSSVTTLVGNPGQANYVAANGYLEGLARARRAESLPALAVGFGAIADAGYLARNAEVNQRLGRRIGKTALDARDALSAVEQYIGSAPDTVDAAVVMISEFDWAAAHALSVVNEALFEVVMRRASQHSAGMESGEIDLPSMIEGKSQLEAQEALFNVIASEIANTLRVPKENISLDSVLKEIGLDSLMAVELGLNFEQNTGFDMPLSSLADNATVGDVTRRLYEKVSARSRSTDGDEEVSTDVQIIDDLSRRHAGQG